MGERDSAAHSQPISAAAATSAAPIHFRRRDRSMLMNDTTPSTATAVPANRWIWYVSGAMSGWLRGARRKPVVAAPETIMTFHATTIQNAARGGRAVRARPSCTTRDYY